MHSDECGTQSHERALSTKGARQVVAHVGVVVERAGHETAQPARGEALGRSVHRQDPSEVAVLGLVGELFDERRLYLLQAVVVLHLAGEGDPVTRGEPLLHVRLVEPHAEQDAGPIDDGDLRDGQARARPFDAYLMNATDDGRLGARLHIAQRRDVGQVEVARGIVTHEVADGDHAEPLKGLGARGVDETRLRGGEFVGEQP